MDQLKKNGVYSVEADVLAKIKENFIGYFADEKATAQTIKETYERYGYLADTHTAVAINAANQYIAATNDQKPMVVDSTASPYKFANNVYLAVAGENAETELAALDALSAKTNTQIPYPLAGLANRKVNFTEVVEKTDMAKAVLDYIAK